MGELIVNGIKIAFLVGIIATFTTAIITILNLISSVALGGVIGEVLSIISNSLPFDASSVFTTIFTSISAILSFMVANKIWSLLSDRVIV